MADPKPLVLVDLMGSHRTITPTHGKATIGLQSETPVFLVGPADASPGPRDGQAPTSR